ncbi:hypothetical protein BWI15_02560 [Kribbella sp. ALI-6-A]|uniref:hypothetical protein n=1 Tax=Kribbella sp. ALI-6-A TaxID=1933817 RepID=UPI00097C898E|nr:hypothetical protein [Kribbella sp. ALI-6-A]ONI77416.1 hypothetical protein BWI15_02560 [Kribbella sp. ALI-6-A]
MTTPQDPGFAGVSALPPYRSLLVVDMKDYSGSPGRYQTELTQQIPKILKATFKRAGLASVWSQKTFHNTTGDGYAVGLPAEILPLLLNPYLGLLQAELEDRNRVRRHGHQSIRFRVSIHVGPVHDSGTNSSGDGSGAARVELHRLLDSQPVRQLLAGSDSEVTHVAGIVSPRAYEDAVLSKYAEEATSLYVPVPIKVKSFEGNAYLRVPKPSGDLLIRGFVPEEPAVRPKNASGERRTAGPGAEGRDPGAGGISSITGGVGTVVNGSNGPLNTGSGNQYVGPPTDGRWR